VAGAESFSSNCRAGSYLKCRLLQGVKTKALSSFDGLVV